MTFVTHPSYFLPHFVFGHSALPSIDSLHIRATGGKSCRGYLSSPLESPCLLVQDTESVVSDLSLDDLENTIELQRECMVLRAEIESLRSRLEVAERVCEASSNRLRWEQERCFCCDEGNEMDDCTCSEIRHHILESTKETFNALTAWRKARGDR